MAPVLTSETPRVKSGISSGIRIAIAILVAILCGIFILLWDGQYMPHPGVPDWIGPFASLPFLATILGFGSNCLIQQLSCGQVQWLVQLQRVAIVPVPFIIVFGILNMITSLRWPIEGLIQAGTPEVRKGLSSGFYGFWTALYTQSILNGLAQICPV